MTVELPLETCTKLCAEPRYDWRNKYPDTDKILSCSAYAIGNTQPPQPPPRDCFPYEVFCTAAYPPGAVACAPVPVQDAAPYMLPIIGYDAAP